MERYYWRSGVAGGVAWLLAALLFGAEILLLVERYLSSDGQVTNGPLVLGKLSLVLLAAWLLLPIAWLTWRPGAWVAGWRSASPLERLEVHSILALLLLFVVALHRAGAYAGPAAPGWLGLDQWHGEDGPLEAATAVLALAAAALLARAAGSLARSARVLVAILAAAAFLFGMEEISWGQRLLGLEAPERLVAGNRQGEINFHNFLGPRVIHLYVPLAVCTAAAAWFCFADRLARWLPPELFPLTRPPHAILLSVCFQLLAVQSVLHRTAEVTEEAVAVLLFVGAVRLTLARARRPAPR